MHAGTEQAKDPSASLVGKALLPGRSALDRMAWYADHRRRQAAGASEPHD